MKSLTGMAVLVQALLVVAQDAPLDPRAVSFGRGGGGRGYGGPFGQNGGSGCAKDCVSSYWETADPTPTAFCDAEAELPGCISSACSGDADEYASYSSRSASLCSEYLSCSSTGTYTYSYNTPGDGDGWGHRGGGRGGGGGGDRTWPTGEVVVTGCPWNGDGWGFPHWGGLGYGSDFWDEMGPGWRRETVTTTVQGESTAEVVVVEQAVSGDQSTLRTLSAEAVETGGGGGGSDDGDESGASALGGSQGVVSMGIALGTVMAMVVLM